MHPNRPAPTPQPSFRLRQVTLLWGAGALLASFALITALMASGVFSQVDRTLLLAFRLEDRSQILGGHAVLQAMRDVTALGSTLVLSLLCLSAALVLSRIGRGRLAALLLGSSIAAQAASWSLKAIFARARPDVVPHLADSFGASYPSGHSLMSAVIWLSIAGIAAHLLPLRHRGLPLVGAVILVAAVGISRIALGVHWPSDVLAGWALGGFWAIGTLAAARHLRLL